VPHFFGLEPNQREIVLEEFYYLMRLMNISYESLRMMPITYRRWFIRRLSKESKNLQEKDQYGLDDDTPISALHRNS
jgi:hypothetical protein